MASFRFLRSLESYGRKKPHAAARSIGGKAARLAWLVKQGIRVPRGWVLDARLFNELVLSRLPPGHDPHSLLRLRSPSTFIERAGKARAMILSEPLPPLLVKDLEVLAALVDEHAPWGLAVRSSATCEDDDLTSMAGLAATEPGVRGAPALAAALRQVWASAFLPRALSYLAARGVGDVAMAVVFQVMVQAEAAGVFFTAPPGGGAALFQPNEMLINVSFGLGAPVVDGAMTPDVAKVDRATGKVVDYLVAEKKQALVVSKVGLEAVDVAPSRRRARALSDRAVSELADLARRLDALDGGRPLDLEFAVEGGQVFIVQARPAVGAGYPDGGDAETVWSRANVGEALPGAATPLTWSVAHAFSERGFRKAFSSLGCSVPKGTTLVASVHGRFYLNMTAFMSIAAQVPGLDPKTLIDLGGGAETELLAAQVAHVSRRGFYARLPLTAARLLTEQTRLASEVDRFDASGGRAYQSLRYIDFTILPDDALATALRDARKVLDQCGELMLSCASASLASHVALKTVLARSLPEGAERVAQALSQGIGDLESALPGLALGHVAAIARREESARLAIESGNLRAVNDLPEGPTRRAFTHFLATYGDRAVREAELSVPRWREDPSPLFSMLRSVLRAAGSDPEAQLKALRDSAERELELIERRLTRVEMTLVRVLVARSQRFARLRERMRAWITRVLGMLRAIALEVDRRLVRADPSLGSGSVFYCTFDELATVLVTDRVGVGDVVRLRRAEFARDQARPDPSVCFVGRPSLAELPPSGSRELLRGLPASGGVVTGPARVLGVGGHDAATLLPGEILVARTTDVGLTPLFLVAAGVVTELGGPLSHAALVAREYGVPAVVNVRGLTTAVTTGEMLRVDGDRGIVERLAHDAAPAARADAGARRE
ncbi:MAG TPA: PEP/pyruvate-binding domain-containing protein [Polyangiaceae bacterium]|nr:PEP/pyruvate-binding domain-containing protein [Polyangiaceae bacterium]